MIRPGDAPVIETARLHVRLAAVEDASDSVTYDDRNRDHLRPWEPRRDDACRFDVAERARSIASKRAEAEADREYRFFARLRDGDGSIVASINLSNVIRGALQGCHLGYSVDAEHQGRGIGSEAVGAVVQFGFRTLHLHRIMASYHPTNERSGRLLRGLGFVVEGYARDYLCIDGAWRDGILTSLVSPIPS